MRSQRNREVFLQWVKSLKKPALAPSLVFTIHVIAYSVFHLYETHPLFDIPHFFGGFAMAYFLDKAFVNASVMSTGAAPNRLVESLLVFTSTCTVAVFWEFAEFIMTWALSTDLQGDLADTMKDLFFGMTGSVFYIAAVSLSTQMASRILNWVELIRVTLKPEAE
ncbi:MAG TPA: hypothetical protein VFF31_34185 [Blastocatellia bacterium]|nr:hypothetical protein [Blastocatellia bacterium]